MQAISTNVGYNRVREEQCSILQSGLNKYPFHHTNIERPKYMSEDANPMWLNHFTRIGFVQHHKEQIDTIQKIQDDSLRQFLIEINHSQDNRDEDKIMKLKQDVRDNVKLLSELGLGTPIISAIKAKLQRATRATVQVR